MNRLTKHADDMPKRAYQILADGGTRAKTKKSEFSESVAIREVAGQAGLDRLMLKAATEKTNIDCDELIKKAEQREFLLYIMPILRKKTASEKLDALHKLCSTRDISLDTYERALSCIDKQVGRVSKEEREELKKKFAMLEQEINMLYN